MVVEVYFREAYQDLPMSNLVEIDF